MKDKKENQEDSLHENNTGEIELPDEIEDILGSIPKESRHEVKRIVGMSMQMGGAFSPQLELMKKMTPEHVSEFLQGQREASNNEFKESRDSKIFMAFVLAVVLVFVVVIVIQLKGNPDILEKVLYTIGGLITGLIGGYGFGKTRSSD